MKDFTVKIWHQTLSMKTMKPIVRLHELKVALSENEVIPKSFETRYLDATMKNVQLSTEFQNEFRYGLPLKVIESIRQQIGNYMKNACLVVLELYPGVLFIIDSICSSIKRGIICDYELPTFSTTLA